VNEQQARVRVAVIRAEMDARLDDELDDRQLIIEDALRKLDDLLEVWR
jgi:hypothetical protein